jgi:hypothetical protein
MSEITGIQNSLGSGNGDLETLRSDLEDIYCDLSDTMLKLARNAHLFYLALSAGKTGRNAWKELGAVLLFSSTDAAEEYRRLSGSPSAQVKELTDHDAKELFLTPDDMFLLNPAVDKAVYCGYDLIK